MLSDVVCLSVCNVGVLWPNGWMHQDETWHACRSRPWPHCVRWGCTSPSPKGAQPLQFSAHICCGQMAGWKMPLGMEVGLSPGNFVLDGHPAPLPKNGAEPHRNFPQCPLWPNSWMDQNSTWHRGGPRSSHIVLDGDPLPTPKGGGAPNFRPMSILVKRLHGSRCHLVRR